MTNLQKNKIDVESKIYLVRGYKVMLDQDLAVLYEVSTMRLNWRFARDRVAVSRLHSRLTSCFPYQIMSLSS